MPPSRSENGCNEQPRCSWARSPSARRHASLIPDRSLPHDDDGSHTLALLELANDLEPPPGGTLHGHGATAARPPHHSFADGTERPAAGPERVAAPTDTSLRATSVPDPGGGRARIRALLHRPGPGATA